VSKDKDTPKHGDASFSRDDTEDVVEVADAIAAVWNRVVGERRLDAPSTVERAVATAGQVGLLT
jgi:hypothetical protein